jgi:hypothetical protein
MNSIECLREQEVMDVVASGRWPARCSEELLGHVSACAICTDAAEVAIALREDYDEAFARAHVPPPGLVWWRAELRARQEAVRKVSRPMTLVQAFGGACAVGVLLAVLSPFWPWFRHWFTLPALPQSDLAAAAGELTALSPLLAQWATPLAFAIGLALLVVAPVAMYLVLSDE